VAWVEVFAVFLVCHFAGDYLLQTDWQALHKRNGLGSDPEARRALFSHVTTYTLAFVPALIWLAGELDAWEVAVVVVLIFVPHLVQDDGRLLGWYMKTVKGGEAAANLPVAAMVDQTFHYLTLFFIALLAGDMST
jgi:uncharacterized protein DUF3307